MTLGVFSYLQNNNELAKKANFFIKLYNCTTFITFVKAIMRTKIQTYNVSEELNRTFGEPGSESRKEAENQAWEEYNAQILLDARKKAGMTQSELAQKIGADKSYISRVERGLTILASSTCYRIVSAMGLNVVLL